MKKLLTFLLAALMIVPGLCACGKQDATVVRLNEVTHSVFYAPQYVAMSQGFFAAEGLQGHDCCGLRPIGHRPGGA